MKLINKKEIIKSALSFINTPYQHQGRLKGVGIDCAGLIIEVIKEVGMDSSFDIKGYDRIPDGQTLSKICNTYGKIKDIKNNYYNLEDGDVILFNFLVNPQHLGFYYKLNNLDYFIHAYGEPSINKVIIQRLDSKWKNRINGVFKINGVE